MFSKGRKEGEEEKKRDFPSLYYHTEKKALGGVNRPREGEKRGKERDAHFSSQWCVKVRPS